jgi:hypothetical protein
MVAEAHRSREVEEAAKEEEAAHAHRSQELQEAAKAVAEEVKAQEAEAHRQAMASFEAEVKGAICKAFKLELRSFTAMKTPWASALGARIRGCTYISSTLVIPAPGS